MDRITMVDISTLRAFKWRVLRLWHWPHIISAEISAIIGLMRWRCSCWHHIALIKINGFFGPNGG
jgi:hypothetical protein